MTKAKNKGYTLIEVLVVALLTSVVGIGVMNALVASNRILIESTRQSFYDFQVNFVLEAISRDIKQGYRIQLPSTYSESIKITRRNPVGNVDEITEWSFTKVNTEKDYGTYPTRKAHDGTVTVYSIPGLEGKNEKIMKAYFTFPTGYTGTFKPSKYFGVNVIVEGKFYTGSSSTEWEAKTQNTIYCRQEEDGILN